MDLPELVKTIRNNPHQTQIETIRALKSAGDCSYKKLKEDLPNITPNCLVKQRNLKDDLFYVNFIAASGYMYFDIDRVSDVLEYKRYIIEKYKHQASLICISSGGDGVSILFKITNNITQDNFDQLRLTLIQNILTEEKVDPNAAGLGRAMFISHDPKVWINYENQITIESKEIELLVNHPNSYSSSYNRVKYHFSDKKEVTGNKNIYETVPFNRYKIYNVDEILATINTKTIVSVSNTVVDFKAVDFAEVYIPRIITDSNKHRTYFKLIHQLYYLNPDIQIDYLYSFIFFINNTRAKPRMETRELVRFFTSVINRIKVTGQVLANKTIKRVHFNPAATLSRKEKETIARNLNGAYTRSITIEKIIAAKQELQLQGKKITNRAISRMIQMDEKTVGKYINAVPVHMDYEVSLWN